jgi:hypothetical protein
MFLACLLIAVMSETYAGAKFTAGGDPLQRTAIVVPARRHTFLSRHALVARCARLLDYRWQHQRPDDCHHAPSYLSAVQCTAYGCLFL